eukprot:TRINITY_DN3233_c2_g1_i2.p1 TRINITY_DN3233_c2_g1~~TRINITY_DN3233_c2_g1_i2.p1  ORF type:complete len:488 (+),score=128.03 TRINITY_DN3233_c2_g1_i2:89-1465(+)
MQGGRRFPPPPRAARNPYAHIAREGRTLLGQDEHNKPKQWQDLWGDGDGISKKESHAKLNTGIIDTVLNALPRGRGKGKGGGGKGDRGDRRPSGPFTPKPAPDHLPRLGEKGRAREAERRKIAYNKQLHTSAAATVKHSSGTGVSWGSKKGKSGDEPAIQPVPGGYQLPEPKSFKGKWDEDADGARRSHTAPPGSRKAATEDLPSWWGKGQKTSRVHKATAGMPDLGGFSQSAGFGASAADFSEPPAAGAGAGAAGPRPGAERPRPAGKKRDRPQSAQSAPRPSAKRKRKPAPKPPAPGDGPGGMSDSDFDSSDMSEAPQPQQQDPAEVAAALEARIVEEDSLASTNYRKQESFRQKPPDKISLQNMPWPALTRWNSIPLPRDSQQDAEACRKHLTRLQLFWHPDKMEQRYGHKFVPEEKDEIVEKVKAVAQAINQLKDAASAKAAASSAAAPAEDEA